MNYERRKITRDEERDIITNMIVDSEFLRRIRPIYRPELLTLSYARTVADWCCEYLKEYDKAPDQDIGSVFESKKDSIRDEERLELISTFLENLSDRWSESEFQINTNYEVDKALKYFKRINQENLIESIRACHITKDYLKADAHIAGYGRIEKNISTGIDLLHDVDAAVRAIRSETDDILFSFPGALGKIVRPIKKKDFVVFVAPAKRKKSWMLQETGLLGMWNQVNVLYISLEMPEEQQLIRIYQRITGELSPEDDQGSDRIVEIPSFDNNFDINGIVNFRKEYKKSISSRNVIKKLEGLRGITKSKKFRLECFPAGSINVSSGIIPLLDNLEHYEDFIPEMLVLDYADILGPESKKEKRHQIDETWQALRGLGQDRSIAIITASHSARATFDRDIRQSDLSEDIRKLHHVTLAVSLNQNDEDEEQNIMRIGVLADRYRKFSKSSEVAILHCLDIGKPYLDSRLVKKDT